MSDAPPVCPDPVVWVTADGDELRRNEQADALLGPAHLLDALEGGSRDKLHAVLAAPRPGVELTTLAGQSLDATVALDGGDARIVVLRDVSRYTAAAEKLATVTQDLSRRNRDLQALYEVAARLSTTLNLSELAQVTCQLLGEYLAAETVEVRVGEHVAHWPVAPGDEPPSGSVPLASVHGSDGSLRWWRRAPLEDSERRLVALIAGRAAIGFDHALALRTSRYLADHDALTGLLNRHGGQRALSTVPMPAAVALLDLDRFKRLNDVHGHETGDEVLQRVAEVLSRSRGTDVVARWGGEEFLLVLPATTAHEAVVGLERLRERVAAGVQVQGTPVTFSGGVADLTSLAAFEAALRAADDALYEAKHRGRNQLVVAEAGLRAG
jgi:diguanylate cyclase (GGDEF)-like protein